jgi:glutaryl-CoA dehydrogenase
MGLGSSFQGLDYADIESLFSDEEKMIRDTVRTFVTDEVLPVIEHHFRDGTFPNHLIPAIGEMGLLGANLHGYGCAGLGSVAYGLIMQELERGDPDCDRSCRAGRARDGPSTRWERGAEGAMAPALAKGSDRLLY